MTELLVDIVRLRRYVLHGSAHTLTDPRSCAPASAPGDNLVLIGSSAPWRRGSSFLPLRPVYRTAAPLPPAYQHSITHSLISFSRTVRPVSASLPQLFRGSPPMIPPIGHCLASDNPPGALQHEYQSDPAAVLISAFDISSRWKAHRCKP